MRLPAPLPSCALCVLLGLVWAAAPQTVPETVPGDELDRAAGTLLAAPEAPMRGPCRGRLGGRVGGCTLSCMLSARLCRVCCKKKPLQDGDADATTTASSATSMRSTKEGEDDGGDGETTEEDNTERTSRPGGDDDDDNAPSVVFPDKLPEGTQDAMLETAAHILAIVTREDPARIRIWVENPQRNLDNLDRLASKLASFPRAPFGRAYWRLVLRSSKDRPFTLLREALAVRTAYQQQASGPAETTASSAETPAEAPGETSGPAAEASSSEMPETSEASSSEGGGAEWWRWR